jgi:hypothetical protein
MRRNSSCSKGSNTWILASKDWGFDDIDIKLLVQYVLYLNHNTAGNDIPTEGIREETVAVPKDQTRGF